MEKEGAEDSTIEISLASAAALARILPDGDLRPLMREKLAAGKGQSPSAAAKYLSAAPVADDYDAFAAGLKSSQWRAKKGCALGLAVLVKGGKTLPAEVIAALVAMLDNDVLNVVQGAQVALSESRGNAEAVAAVAKAAGTHGDGGEADTTWRLRAGAIETLGLMGEQPVADNLTVVLAGLGDDTKNVVQASQKALARVPVEKRFPGLLKELAAAKETRTRAGIMEAMGNRVPADQAEPTAKIAKAALTDPGEGADASRVRAAAISLLSGLPEPGQYAGACAGCLGDEAAAVREAAAGALMRSTLSAEQKAQVADIAVNQLQAKDAQRIVTALTLLENCPSAKAAPAVAKCLPHESLEVQQAACSVLLTWAKDPAAAPAVEAALVESLPGPANSRSWEFGARVLGAMKAKSGVPVLTEMLKWTGEDADQAHARAQIAAAGAVAAIGVPDAAAMDALKALGNHQFPQVKSAAAAALRVLQTVPTTAPSTQPAK
jgi:hypothetical protein